MQKLMILDGNSLLNRAFYGIRPLTTQEGIPTNAIFGFLSTLQRLEAEEKPDALCVAFDRKAPTFRHLRYADYKGTRKGMPEELAVQMPLMQEVLESMRIPCYAMDGWEADDLIGTVARRCEAEGWECVIVTGDKDSLQLIRPHTRVKLVTTRMGQTTTKDMTEKAFQEVYGFAPLQLIDLKALMGDASDNIPGVKGVGEKTAMDLVQRYGTVAAMYADLSAIEAKPAVLRKLQEGEEMAKLSYELATIRTDAPIAFVPTDALRQAPNESLYPLLLRLEFTKFITQWGLTPTQEKTETIQPLCVKWLDTEEEAQTALQAWQELEHISLLSLPDLRGIAVQAGEDTVLWLAERYQGEAKAFLTALFGEKIRKVSHGVKDLMRELLEQELPLESFIFDIALAGYLFDATAGGYSLDRLYLAYTKAELGKATYLEAKAFTEQSAEAENSFAQAVMAVETLYTQLAPKLQEEHLQELFSTIEMPLCAVLAHMEKTGLLVDGQSLEKFGAWLKEEMEKLEQTVYDYAGERFNLQSPKQLGEILFGKLGLPHGKKTKTGWSTNAETLEKLRWSYPIVDAILTYRQYAKLNSTYVEGLGKSISEDGRIHTSFQMTVTATGRLSSAEPNLQNIPTRTELGSQLRKMFVAPEGCVLVDADYSQIELRILAHMAEDTAMQEAFRSGADIHTATAAQVFGVPLEEVTHTMRSRAKAVNFGIVYGISAFSLSQDIGVSVAEAKEYMEHYFSTFPEVQHYLQRVVNEARESGQVETLYHRRRALPEIQASNFNLRSFGERVAMNMPIQGTAADIMKLAMVRVFGRLQEEGLQAKLLLQVHDELIVECPIAEQETVKRLLREEMEGAARLAIPLLTETHVGSTWLEAKG